MDIFDILLDILLKPPQPFIGLFFCSCTRYCGRAGLSSGLSHCGCGCGPVSLQSFLGNFAHLPITSERVGFFPVNTMGTELAAVVPSFVLSLNL